MELDKRLELMKILKGRQDRFVYYIAGLNVASIGFTLSKTFDLIPNRYLDIFLALALLSWTISCAKSFQWIYLQFRTMETNIELSDLINGDYDKRKIDEAQKRELMSQNYSLLERDAMKCERAILVSLIFFATGIVMFILWRIFDAFI